MRSSIAELTGSSASANVHCLSWEAALTECNFGHPLRRTIQQRVVQPFRYWSETAGDQRPARGSIIGREHFTRGRANEGRERRVPSFQSHTLYRRLPLVGRRESVLADLPRMRSVTGDRDPRSGESGLHPCKRIAASTRSEEDSGMAWHIGQLIRVSTKW